MSVKVQNGIRCGIESKDRRAALGFRVFDGARAALFYLALWGALCSMASLSTFGILPLAAGGLLAFGLALPHKLGFRRRWWVLAAGVAALAVVLLMERQTVPDGVRLILNRLFAASQSRQAYVYEMFSVAAEEGDWQRCIRWALFPLGILTGGACGTVFRFQWRILPAVIFLVFAGAAAYLGVSPETGWCVLLAAALALSLVKMPERGGRAVGAFCCAACLLPAALVCVVVLAAAPGEDMRLSAWEERARDGLALYTAAYADAAQRPEPKQQAAEEERFYLEEEMPADLGGGERDWTEPLSAGLVILLFAVLLFLPALWSDLRRKRRAKNRQGLDDPDNNASIRAMFLYTLRWLRLGGLSPANIPFSGYAEQIGILFPEAVRAGFEAALPLWQEAAYSDHMMADGQRERMRRFMEDARQAVWDGLGKRKRILAKYFYAL